MSSLQNYVIQVRRCFLRNNARHSFENAHLVRCHFSSLPQIGLMSVARFSWVPNLYNPLFLLENHRPQPDPCLTRWFLTGLSMYVYLCVCLSFFALSVCLYACIFVCVYVCTFEFLYVCMYAFFTYVCMFVCLGVCVCFFFLNNDFLLTTNLREALLGYPRLFRPFYWSVLGIVLCFGLAWARHFIEQMDPRQQRSNCAMS